MQCVGQFSAKPTASGDDVAAAVHRWMEELSDIGIIRTWHLTRGKPNSSTSMRGFVLSIEADDITRVQAAVSVGLHLPIEIHAQRAALMDLLDTPQIELEPVAAARRSG